MSNGSETASWWLRPAGGREVLQIAVPMVVTTLSVTMMNFIDSAILMSVSPTAMTAAYTAGLIWFAALSLFFGVCSYGATFVAQYYGDDQPEKIGPAVWQGVWLAISFSLVVPIVQSLAPALFAAFKHEAELARLESLFFQILCYGAPGWLIGQSLECFYSGRGKTWVVMVVDLGAVLINLALACMLVLGWGVESWGVPGAAWATVIAQWCRGAIYACLVLLPSNRRDFNTADCFPNLALLRRMIRFGGPSGVQMMLDVVGFSFFVLIVGKLGVTESVATNSTFRLSQLAFMPVWGLGMATAILVGQKLGEDRPDLAQRAARTTLGMSLTYMIGLSLLFILIPRVLLEGIYFLSHEAKAESSVAAEALTVELMRFVSAYNIFDAAVIILVSVLRGAGDTRFVMFTSSVMATLLVLGSYFGVNRYDLDIYGAWWFLSAWIFGLGVVYTARYRTGKWKEMRVIDQIHHAHGAPPVKKEATGLEDLETNAAPGSAGG